MLGVAACKISSTYATHFRQLWLARNEVLHTNTDKPQINIVCVVETAEIQGLYQQPHSRTWALHERSQTATQWTAIVKTKNGFAESGSQLMNKARRDGINHILLVYKKFGHLTRWQWKKATACLHMYIVHLS